MTIADHQESRLVAEPYRLFDCCLQTDGAAALLVTTADRARDLRRKPVLISGAAGSPPDPTDDYLDTPIRRYADRLFATAGVSRDEIDLMEVYDNFSDFPMRMIEDFGYCERGEAKDFINTEGIDLDGRLPLQTAGGLMSEGYAFHVNNLCEAVQQLRGEAEDLCPGWRDGVHTFDRGVCRQVRQHETAINTMGLGYGTVVLRRAS
jgi:acetyl-CoA acetyltransferase